MNISDESRTAIRIRYRSCDGYSQSRRYKTMKGARAWATEMVGENADFGSDYAVSTDGIGTIRVSGCTMAELFGREPETAADESPRQFAPEPAQIVSDESRVAARMARDAVAAVIAQASAASATDRPYRVAYENRARDYADCVGECWDGFFGIDEFGCSEAASRDFYAGAQS